MVNLLIALGLVAAGGIAPAVIRGCVAYYRTGQDPFIRMSDRGRRYDWCKKGLL